MDKLEIPLSDRMQQGHDNFVGEKVKQQASESTEINDLEGKEEMCFINANDTWYRKEPNFQYQYNYQ